MNVREEVIRSGHSGMDRLKAGEEETQCARSQPQTVPEKSDGRGMHGIE